MPTRMPLLWQSVAADVTERARPYAEQMKRFVFDTPRVRAASLLLGLASQGAGVAAGGPVVIGMRLLQERFAEVLGISLQWATSLVRELVAAGLRPDAALGAAAAGSRLGRRRGPGRQAPKPAAGGTRGRKPGPIQPVCAHCQALAISWRVRWQQCRIHPSPGPFTAGQHCAPWQARHHQARGGESVRPRLQRDSAP